ncbi:MAG: ComEC/Rec2 family competence protein [Treponema sp.]|jgi:competence protein ComEC|nr:ComEC/Rec2 family competence protein [Treponema sp.]
MVIYITPLLCAALGGIIGFYILGAEITVVFLAVIAVVLVFTCFLRSISSLYKKSRVLKFLTIRCVLLCSGIVFGVCAANSSRNVIKFGMNENKITAIKGMLLEDPRVISNGNVIVPVSLRECAGNNGARVSASGRISVFFPPENAQRLRDFGRGSLVYTEGTFRASRTGITFNAQSVHIVKPASNINRLRTDIRLNLMSRFEGTSWGGLALALLLGIRDNLDSNLAEHYRNAGCSFILALSGMHLAVIASIIAFFLKKPLGMKGAAVTGAVIIILYCFIVGPMPSLNRAALMYLLGVITILGALPKDPLQILSLSFLIQIAVFPAQGNSISFILSYMALAGILVIGYPVYALFSGYIPDLLLKPLSASCGAFLATAGITAFSFGFLSPVGILAGLVLAPLTTVFMAASMFSLLPDLFSFGWLIGKFLSLLYILMEKIVTLASYVPGITSDKPMTVIVLSVFFSLGIIILDRGRREETLNPLPLA